jgi:hypothetical protein
MLRVLESARPQIANSDVAFGTRAIVVLNWQEELKQRVSTR